MKSIFLCLLLMAKADEILKEDSETGVTFGNDEPL